MELTNWKTVHKKEAWGDYNYGIEIRVAVPRDLNENDERAMYKIADEIESAIMSETVRLDPKVAEYRKKEREDLLACFKGRDILVEEIPNGYCSRWCCSQTPWFKVTTSNGVVTLGWRKSVIQIEWEPRVFAGLTAEMIFPDENVTKSGRMIHAHGLNKAEEYISKILA
jgi:hypothetical protein